MLLHRVWNILCLYILPALKKGKEPDCSLTFFLQQVLLCTVLRFCMIVYYWKGSYSQAANFPHLHSISLEFSVLSVLYLRDDYMAF